MATMKQLRLAADRLGAILEIDDDCQCYRAIAPIGYIFEPTRFGGALFRPQRILHEYIAVFGSGIIGNGQTKADARADLLERLNDVFEHCQFQALPGIAILEECPVKDCDYCENERMIRL